MSRIGKKPVAFTPDVKVAVKDGVVTVEGKLGKLSLNLPPHTSAEVQENQVVVTCDDHAEAGMYHGYTRSLVNNMVIGVSKGYSKGLQIVGVGYKATLAGNKLTLNLGYSHIIEYIVPAGIKMNIVDGVKIQLSGIDKQLVGEVAASIRRYKKPEPYKGKGVRYSDEHVVIKPGKTNA
jgi:large subunit ribosomal protein L6